MFSFNCPTSQSVPYVRTYTLQAAARDVLPFEKAQSEFLKAVRDVPIAKIGSDIMVQVVTPFGASAYGASADSDRNGSGGGAAVVGKMV
jgi:hypothetical protein